MSSSSEEDVAPEEEKEEEVTSWEPCAACKHRRNKCPPNCPFAPYFSPHDGARFAAVQSVFGMKNVAKILADLPEEHRADAVDSLVHQAVERQKNPTYGCASYVSLLDNIIREVRGQVAAAREKLVGHVGREAAFQPFDPATAPPEARQLAEASLAEALQCAREWDEMVRADAEAEAAKAGIPTKGKQGRPVPKNDGTGLASPGGRVRVQGPLQQPAGAQTSAAAQQYQAEQYAMMRRQITAGKQKVMPQPLGGAQNQQMAEAGMTGVKRKAAGKEQCYHAAMTHAQQLADAQKMAWETQYVLMVRQAAAAAGLTVEQYLIMMNQKLDVTGGQAENYGGMGLTGDQSMTTMQQTANTQQLSANAMPGSGSGSGATIMQFLPEGLANADASLVQHQTQPQPPVDVQVEEEPSLPQLARWMHQHAAADNPPWWMGDAEALLVEQKPQPQSQTANVPVQEELSLPPMSQWLRQQESFQQTFVSEQQEQPRPQTVNALGSQVEPSLPPSQAGLPGQQQNDGGNEGQSTDTGISFHAFLPMADNRGADPS
ncbi:hypothetical protein PR202_ga28300 [Eleusine coracana subsp. coracana]|uniref:LOB domain-containing protein n=1 Tax=Eleusine coracana subsp. coracana TaxID=191504 RepID=A0AAV5DIW3_ELECO|nr:hypothetical protein PR202_ga28300 [Eleusine coracana subsp. coracana]